MIVTAGPVQPRLKPGIAVDIVRECLAALAALHRDGIVHGDIKPSNIMLKRTGNAKMVDIGSAFDTGRRAAAAHLHAHLCRARSARRGRVLRRAPTWQPGLRADRDARRACSRLPGLTTLSRFARGQAILAQRLPQLLPREVVCNELLMNFCRGLIAPDPMRRFPSAEAADLVKEGAASFHRQLVVGGPGQRIRKRNSPLARRAGMSAREILLDTHRSPLGTGVRCRKLDRLRLMRVPGRRDLIEQWFHGVGDREHREMLRREKFLLAHVRQQLHQRIVKARAVEQADRLQMHAQLQPGEHFDHFLERANAAGQGAQTRRPAPTFDAYARASS